MLRQLAVVAFFVVMIVFNILSNSASVWPFKHSNSEISRMYPTVITPAGFTFSVWGVIYAFIGLYVVYQLLPAQRENPFLKRVAYLQCANFGLNSLWLVVFSNMQLWLSVFVIVANLYVLYRAHQVLGIGLRKVSLLEKICCHAAVSTNLSWVLVANLANLTLTLKANGFDAPSDWAVAWIVFAGVVALYVALTRADTAYIAVYLWASFGIASNHKDDDTIYSVTVFCAAVVALVFVVSALVEKRYATYDNAGVKLTGSWSVHDTGVYDDYKTVARSQAQDDNVPLASNGVAYS